MKTYEMNNAANQLKANVEVTEKTFMDFFKDVKDERIVPLTDENENIIGFNVVKERASRMKVCKMVEGKLTVGDTEEDRVNDEVAMRKFMEEYAGCDLVHWFTTAMMLIKSEIDVDDVVEVDGETYVLNAETKKVIDLQGNVIVDLSEDEDLDGASKKIIIKLLKAAINAEF